MTVIWSLASAASLFGAIAGAVLETNPYTAVAFGLLGVVFAYAAYHTVKESKK